MTTVRQKKNKKAKKAQVEGDEPGGTPGGQPADDDDHADPDDAEARKKTLQLFDKSLALLNTLYGRMAKELGEVEFTKRKLQARAHWGDGPVQFLDKETKKWVDKNAETLNMWMEVTTWKTDELAKIDLTKEKFVKDQWLEKIKDIDAYKKATEDKYKTEFVKGVLGEFASLKR